MMIIMRRVYLDNDLILGKFLEPPESEVEPFKVFFIDSMEVWKDIIYDYRIYIGFACIIGGGS